MRRGAAKKSALPPPFSIKTSRQAGSEIVTHADEILVTPIVFVKASSISSVIKGDTKKPACKGRSGLKVAETDALGMGVGPALKSKLTVFVHPRQPVNNEPVARRTGVPGGLTMGVFPEKPKLANPPTSPYIE